MWKWVTLPVRLLWAFVVGFAIGFIVVGLLRAAWPSRPE